MKKFRCGWCLQELEKATHFRKHIAHLGWSTNTGCCKRCYEKFNRNEHSLRREFWDIHELK